MYHLRVLLFVIFFAKGIIAQGQRITIAGQPAQLDIRVAGEHNIRITVKPISYKEDFPSTPALADRDYAKPIISLQSISKIVRKTIGKLHVEIRPDPLTIIVTNQQGQPVQDFIFNEDGTLSFRINDGPILGMGEGCSKPATGIDWRSLPVEFDRCGRYDKMQPRWQSDAYGSRNPVAMLIGTYGWATFIASPWVEVDLQHKDRGGYTLETQRKRNSTANRKKPGIKRRQRTSPH